MSVFNRSLRRLRKRAFTRRTGRDVLMVGIGIGVVLTGLHVTRQPASPASPRPLRPENGSLSIQWLPETVRRWEPDLLQAGRLYDIDPNLLAIIMTVESGGFPRAESSAGAQGLMQVTPPTAKDIAVRYLNQPRQDYNLFDPRTSIEFGAAYLAMLRDEFASGDEAQAWNNTVELVAAGYNGGPSAANSLDSGEGLRSSETLSYSRDVRNLWRERYAASSPTYERWLERGGNRLVEAARSVQAVP